LPKLRRCQFSSELFITQSITEFLQLPHYLNYFCFLVKQAVARTLHFISTSFCNVSDDFSPKRLFLKTLFTHHTNLLNIINKSIAIETILRDHSREHSIKYIWYSWHFESLSRNFVQKFHWWLFLSSPSFPSQQFVRNPLAKLIHNWQQIGALQCFVKITSF
jgi:hypothetical protein